MTNEDEKENVTIDAEQLTEEEKQMLKELLLSEFKSIEQRNKLLEQSHTILIGCILLITIINIASIIMRVIIQ